MNYAGALAMVRTQLAAKYSGTSDNAPITRGEAAKLLIGTVNVTSASHSRWNWWPPALALLGYHKPGDPLAGGARQAGEFLDDDQRAYLWFQLGQVAAQLDAAGVPFDAATLQNTPASDVEALAFVAQLATELMATTTPPTWTGIPESAPWSGLAPDQMSASVTPITPVPDKPPPSPITPPNPVQPIVDFETALVGLFKLWIGYEILKRL